MIMQSLKLDLQYYNFRYITHTDQISPMRKFAIFVALMIVASAIKIETFYDADPQQCIEEKCPTEWAACQKDSKCVPALQDCEKKCGTSKSCWTLCLPSKGSQAAVDVAKCADKNKCLGIAPEVNFDAYSILAPQDCIREKCPDQLKACEKDNKCFPTLQDCEKECINSTSCWTTCLAKKGNQAASDLFKCIQDNNCFANVAAALAVADPQQCIEEKCPNEWAACQKDSKCVPALQDCEKKCGTSKSCWTLCLPSKGSQAAVDVAKCADKNKCLGIAYEEISTAIAIADPQQCIEEKCPTEWAACQKDSKCVPALQECEKKCGTGKSCWTLCLSTKGSQAAIDVAKCADKNNCLATSTQLAVAGPQECIEKYCKTQEQLCENDRRCISTLSECDNRCNTDLACWNTCLSRAGNKNASDYIKCLVDNKCLNATNAVAVIVADPQQCIEEKCPNEWAACQKDSKCVPALQDCEKKCGTSKSCWTLCLPSKGSQAAVDVAKCADKNKCLGSYLSLLKASTEVAVDPLPCVEEKCPTQWAACQKDSKCVPAIQDCQKKCGTGTTCWTFCLPSKGSQAAIDVAKCAQAQKCLGEIIVEEVSTALAVADPQQCIEEKCPNEWAACQKDSKCVPALQDCEKKCGTSKSCWTLCLPSKGSQAAVDVAKCADKNKCLGMAYAFETCMSKSCFGSHVECLANWECRNSMRICRTGLKAYDFDLECLAIESKKSSFIASWFTCAGESFCL